MGERYMAFDYGTKRIGVAVTDPLRLIATGLTTIHPQKMTAFLTTYLASEKVSLFIVGKPLQLDNTPSAITHEVEAFIRSLQKNFPSIAITRMDERFTTKMAHRAMLEGGLKKKARQNKALVDKVSATILLQSYMERLQFLDSQR